ncbi:MAG TPA: CDP-alcohol phosphatidyltransferase family protein [Thermomicrobiales bacterium]|nr:CDP-alcohol phosphatidyltransferase family protein [Thermomicrobiales bacterium]
MPDPTLPHRRTPRSLDEWISAARLGLAAALWIPAALRKPRLVACGIVLSALSDIADGLVCRFRGDRSAYSRQLDTVADSAVMLSALGWLALARPGGLDPLRRTLCVIALVASSLLTIQWRRYRMIGALHIDSARAAAIVGHLYVLNMLWRDAASKPLRRLFQLLVAGGMVESAWVILGPHDPLDGSPRPLLQWLKRTTRS